MKTSIKKFLKNQNKRIFSVLKILGILIVFVLGLMFILPTIFSDEIEDIIQHKANESLVTEFKFSSTDITFFRHFPSLTFSFDDLSLKEANSDQPSDLLSAKEIYFKINIFKLIFKNEVKIDGIAIDEANFSFKTDRFGQSNYNVYKLDDKEENTPDSTSTKSSELFLEIDEFTIKNSQLLFDDKSTKIKIKAQNFDLEGDGSFIQKDVFLKTLLNAETFVLQYDGVEYITNKKVEANLQTKFNSDELTFKFDDNNIFIKQLPVFFNGEFSILKNGYHVDFDVKIEDTDWVDIFSAFPPKYENWTKQTEITGNANANFILKGYYRPLKNENLDLDVTINTTNASLSSKSLDEKIKDITIDAVFHIPQLNVDYMDFLIENFQFSINDESIKGQYISKHDNNGLYINHDIQGKLNLNNISKAIDIEGFDLGGVMEINLLSTGYYKPEVLQFPKSKGKFTTKNATLKTPYYPNPIDQISADIQLTNLDETYDNTVLSVDTLNFVFEGQQFSAKAIFKNFENIDYDIQAKGKFNLNRFYSLFSKQVNNAEGYIEADLNLKGKKSDFSNEKFVNTNNTGRLKFKDISVQFPTFPHSFLLKEGQFEFSDNQTNFNNFNFAYGESNLMANGKFDNLISYVLSPNKILKGELDLESEYLNFNEFIPSFDAKSDPDYDAKLIDTTSTATYGVFEVPHHVDLSAKISAKNILYDSLSLKNLSASIQIANDSLFIKNSKFEMIDSKTSLSGFYTNNSRTEADFGIKIDIDNFDIKRAYNDIYLFREMVTAAATAEGISSVNYDLNGKLDAEMYPILPSLEGQGVLKIKKAKIQGYKLFGAISKATKNESLSEADIKAVEIPSRIKDNIVTVDEFKMKTGILRLKSEGEFSFDEQINFKMRIGLPPLGIIGIPIKITGTSDEYSIKLGKKTEDLETVSYQDYLDMQKDSLNKAGLDSLQLQKLDKKYNPTPKPEAKTDSTDLNLEQQ